MKLKFILVWISVLCGIMLHAQKFAILSDIHVTPGNANETKLKAAVEEINSSDVDYVLITGDLTNEGSDEQLRNVKSIFDRITKPQYAATTKTPGVRVLAKPTTTCGVPTALCSPPANWW